MIEHIEKFGAELQIRVLMDSTDPDSSRQGGVEVRLTRPQHNPDTGVTPASASCAGTFGSAPVIGMVVNAALLKYPGPPLATPRRNLTGPGVRMSA